MRWGKVVATLVLVALGAWAVSGKTDELSGATGYLDHLRWGWLAVAALAETLSYLAYAGMQRRLLHVGGVRPGLRTMTGIALAGNAIQNTLPAGVVISAAFAFRQFRRFGADEALSGWVVVAMTVLSFISLSILAAVGLGLAASSGSALNLVTTIIGLLVIVAALVAAWARRQWILSLAPGAVRLVQRFAHRPSGDAEALVADARERIGALSPSHRDWAVAGAFAAANWILDLACLLCAFLAVGGGVPWQGVLLAYSAAQLAANLPLTPGGLGVVEGSLTIGLVAFGGGQASTVAAVLLYRLASFWALLPIGWGSWAVLTLQARREVRPGAGSPGAGSPGAGSPGAGSAGTGVASSVTADSSAEVVAP